MSGGGPKTENAKTRKSENAKESQSRPGVKAAQSGSYLLCPPLFFRVFALSRFRVLSLCGRLPGSRIAPVRKGIARFVSNDCPGRSVLDGNEETQHAPKDGV